MKGQELTNWRESVTANLTEVKTDVKWIKDNFGIFEHRQRHLEKQVSWLRGLGSIVGIILASVLALVSSIVMRSN